MLYYQNFNFGSKRKMANFTIKKISVAMDGPAGAGKSSIARVLADDLGFLYLSTGELYRSFTYACLNNGYYVTSPETLLAVLRHLDFSYNVIDTQQGKRLQVTLNKKDISPYIHEKNISKFTPKVACYPNVRAYFRQIQQDLATKYDIVMEGRDICSVVLPNATFKFYIDASPEARASRRCKQLNDISNYDKVLAEIKQRDKLDMERETCPLKAYSADTLNDIVYIDTSYKTLPESIDTVKTIVQQGLDKINLDNTQQKSTQLEK